MKKIFTIITIVAIIFSGCSGSTADKSNLKSDSIKLMSDLTTELELVVNKDVSNYSTSWYTEKYKNESNELALECIDLCGRFENIKDNRDIEKLGIILDDMLKIIEKLK